MGNALFPKAITREITREIISKGIAEAALKEQRRQKAEEAKEQRFYILLGMAAVAFIAGTILIAGTKRDKATA